MLTRPADATRPTQGTTGGFRRAKAANTREIFSPRAGVPITSMLLGSLSAEYKENGQYCSSIIHFCREKKIRLGNYQFIIFVTNQPGNVITFLKIMCDVFQQNVDIIKRKQRE